MERKFECKNCKAHFEADDAKQVLCPNCGSDNVEYEHFHIPSKVWKLLAGILTLLIIGFIASKINWKQGENQGESISDVNDSLSVDMDSTYINETGLSLPPVINVGNLSFEGKGYIFDVTVENPPSAKFYYVIVDPYDNRKIVSKNESGHFVDVPYSNADGGMYEVALYDSSVDTIICGIEKTGFIKQQPVSKKMTATELQSKINNHDFSLMGVGENDYLSPEYELKLVGLSGDAVNVPKTLGEIYDKLENEIWESVKVKSIEYDDMNRISKITLFVKEF